jgi:hypothetical protein
MGVPRISLAPSLTLIPPVSLLALWYHLFLPTLSQVVVRYRADLFSATGETWMRAVPLSPNPSPRYHPHPGVKLVPPGITLPQVVMHCRADLFSATGEAWMRAVRASLPRPPVIRQPLGARHVSPSDYAPYGVYDGVQVRKGNVWPQKEPVQ